jgi:predicted DNA-binding transcriptional regulator AlpA
MVTPSTRCVTTAPADRVPRPAVDPELLDVRAVATLLGGCSTRHVFRLADGGRMPAPLKLGSLVRWRRGEVLDWIAAGCLPTRPTKASGR